MSTQSQNKSTAPVQRSSSSSPSRSASPSSSRPTPAPSTTGAAAARTANSSSAASARSTASNSSSGSTGRSTASNSSSRWDSESRKRHTDALSSAWGEDKSKEESSRNAAASSNQQADIRYRNEAQTDEQSRPVDEAGNVKNDPNFRDKQTTDPKPTPDNKPTQDTRPTPEVKPEPKPEETKKKNDPFDENRTKLKDEFKKSLDEQSMQRMDKMMGEFENRMAALAAMKIEAYRRQHGGNCPPEMAQKFIDEAKQKVNDTYKHLTEMVGTPQGSGELFGQKERTSLAEGLMFHLADPRTFDQGSNGTCWINSSTASYGLMTQPDDMARFMKEISLTGQFQAYNNGQAGGSPTTIRFNKNMFYSTGQERNWSIGNAIGGSARSPVGMFLDEAMTEMVGKRRADAGDYNGQWGAKRIMTMITGEVPPQPRGRLGNARTNRQMTQDDLTVALEYGGFQIYSPGHLQSVHFVPDGKFSWGEDGGIAYNGNSLGADGKAPMSGFFILDNQWGERNDFVTHHVNTNGQIQDIQDQRFQHYDPGKVNNERNIAINPGNDSGGGGGGGGGWDDGGGGGGGGGGFGEGGLLGIIQAILQAIFGGGAMGGGGAEAGGGAEGWAQLLEQLVNGAEGECCSGAPGQAYDALEQAMPYLVGEKRPKQELMERIHGVLQQGSQRRLDQWMFPDEVDMLG